MFAKANKYVSKLGESEPGLDAVEYFLIAGVVALGAVVAGVDVDVRLTRVFGAIGGALARAL